MDERVKSEFPDIWFALVSWFEQTLMAKGIISREAFELFEVLDTPQQVVDTIYFL